MAIMNIIKAGNKKALKQPLTCLLPLKKKYRAKIKSLVS